ncbi:ABC transporter permease subunit [Okibacterium endophyticum]
MSTNTIAPRRWAAGLIVGVIGAVFLIPMVSMFAFTLRGEGGMTADHWLNLLAPERPGLFAPVWIGLSNSLVLALVTIAIILFVLAPTLVLVTLRFPRLCRVVEFVCLLPLSIPAVALVVGLAPVYLSIGRVIGAGVWQLAFAYGITCLPFAYRAIQANLDAVDTRTLAEAARSLGASWTQVLIRVIAPNIRVGLLLASLISLAAVLGEFTIASLLNRQNLQTALLVVSKQDPYTAVIVSLLSLGFVFVLLLLVDRVSRSMMRRAR